MRVAWHEGYAIPLPDGHRFPMAKYAALRGRLGAEGLLAAGDVLTPQQAPEETLRLVHTDAYLRDLAAGTLAPAAERRLGLPWSPALWRRSRLVVAGTLLAARAALIDGLAANLAGGTHHAFADRGEGFCVLHDAAVAVRALRRDGAIGRALLVDLDVHQGNGSAAIFRDDPATYTFSVHGERNYPFAKERSDRDVALPDGIGDAGYLEAVARHLPAALAEARPDLIFYLAGVDPVRGDRFGRLDLSPGGLARRERLVLESCRRAGVPVVILAAGGYAATPEAAADLHATVHREARRVFGADQPAAPAGIAEAR